MKTAFSTVACMGASWKDVLTWTVNAHIDAVEVRLNDDGSMFGLTAESIPQMACAFHEAGIVISNLGTSVCFSGYDEKALERLVPSIRLAEQTGARGIRVFPGSFVKRFDTETPHDLDGMALFLQKAAAVAQKHGVEIWIETHNEFSTGKSMRRLLDKAQCANITVIWDLIHPYEYGEQPEETLRQLSGFIAHIHVKDGKKASDVNQIDYLYTRLGEGELPLHHIFGILEKSGYKGYYSLEWEKAWRPEIRHIYASEEMLLSDWNTFLAYMKGVNHV